MAGEGHVLREISFLKMSSPVTSTPPTTSPSASGSIAYHSILSPGCLPQHLQDGGPVGLVPGRCPRLQVAVAGVSSCSQSYCLLTSTPTQQWNSRLQALTLGRRAGILKNEVPLGVATAKHVGSSETELPHSAKLETHVHIKTYMCSQQHYLGKQTVT